MSRFIKRRTDMKQDKVGISPTAKAIQKKLLKVENEIVEENRKFCAIHSIYWTKEHDTCLRNALRTHFANGVMPIFRSVSGS